MTGTALAERVRNISQGLRVIFATGHSHVKGAEPDERTLVLVKPFGTEELKAAIASLAFSDT
jgi:DNA-binding LytR/AlgR family response regulator